MSSWQNHLIKTVFKIRRLFHPPTGVLDVEKARAENEKLASYFKIRANVIADPVMANQVPAEWIIPANTSPDHVILYLHGGAYNSGSITSHRSVVANIAGATGCRALLIDYRLAPEHPFPAALEDARAAYQWLLENEWASDQIIIAGDSCGGGLTLSLLLSLKDANEPLPAAAVCLSPWTDLTCTGESWKTNINKDIMLDPGALSDSARAYLAGADPKTPLASPHFADLHGLPPLLIQVGSDELVLSDSLDLAEHAEAAGLDVELEVWDSMQHEWHFAASILPEARQAIDQIGQFMRKHLGLD